jgi:recombination protein RecA
MFGNPETTTGGRALKFYASVRIDVRRVQTLKVGDEMVGSHTKAKIVKNKVAPPFREAEFDIMYGQGISHTGELVDLGVELGLVEKSGSWFSMGDVRLGQGRDNVKLYFQEHPEAAEELEQKIRTDSYKLMSRQSLAAAQAAGRLPAAESTAEPAPESAPEGEAAPAPAAEPKRGRGRPKKTESAPVPAPAPRDMDEFDALLNLDISAEDFEG